MTTKKFTPPKTLAACADLLYKTREERYAANKVVEALKEKEAILREHIIDNLPKSQATGITGKTAMATIEKTSVWKSTDWDKTFDYIVKNRKKGAFAILQKRLSETALNEIVAHTGKPVPGAELLTVLTVSCTKRK